MEIHKPNRNAVNERVETLNLASYLMAEQVKYSYKQQRLIKPTFVELWVQQFLCLQFCYNNQCEITESDYTSTSTPLTLCVTDLLLKAHFHITGFSVSELSSVSDCVGRTYIPGM